MIRLMLVDDHELVRTGLRRLLEDNGDYEIVAEAECGEDAIKLVREHKPDVVLMDLNMPGMGGLETTRKLKHSFEKLHIIIVTMIDDVVFPAKLLKAGASGYITKGAKVDEIVRAIRDVMVNKRYISPALAQKMAIAPIEEGKSPFDDLSERELQVMMMLMDGHRVGDISDKLCLSPKTVSTYRYRLYDKLNVKNDIELTRLAIEHGMLTNN